MMTELMRSCEPRVSWARSRSASDNPAAPRMPAFTKPRRSVRATEFRKSEQVRAGMRAFRREKSAGGNASERLNRQYPAFTSNARPQFAEPADFRIVSSGKRGYD